MSKEIDTPEFWRERIEFAKKHGKMNYSVFFAHEALWKKINEAHQEILDKEVKWSDKVLDAGCGYGRTIEMLKCAEYTGVDFSVDFIEEAKKKYPKGNFIQADLRQLPFKDKEFDVAVVVSIKKMIQANMSEKEWDVMEEEIKRVARKVVILEYGIDDRNCKLEANQYEVI